MSRHHGIRSQRWERPPRVPLALSRHPNQLHSAVGAPSSGQLSAKAVSDASLNADPLACRLSLGQWLNENAGRTAVTRARRWSPVCQFDGGCPNGRKAIAQDIFSSALRPLSTMSASARRRKLLLVYVKN
ncbi:hypothetical protein PsYK624_131280 [Phanerochaete sordida]|uniref:Uncharacterized protein n=1 Tax=Phanerochaete sordida TaxID=48140 RepID=A0A9P3GKI6_9APHY|nr:hypothetical protein PsYK624_131280 [Phanerochaete sordida]